MGVNFHITRISIETQWELEDKYDAKSNITMEQWIKYIDDNNEMRLDGYASADLGKGQRLTCYDPSMAVWLAHPDKAITAWIWLEDSGMITVKNPDEAMIKQLFIIANEFNAVVQDENGETYNKDGYIIDNQQNIITPHINLFKINNITTPIIKSKPWWKFWGK